MPNMDHPRQKHACGVINQDTLLVAGGKDVLGFMLDSVQIFSIMTMEWIDSTPLPGPLISETSLQSGYTVLVLSGTKIYTNLMRPHLNGL